MTKCVLDLDVENLDEFYSKNFETVKKIVDDEELEGNDIELHTKDKDPEGSNDDVQTDTDTFKE